MNMTATAKRTTEELAPIAAISLQVATDVRQLLHRCGNCVQNVRALFMIAVNAKTMPEQMNTQTVALKFQTFARKVWDFEAKRKARPRLGGMTVFLKSVAGKTKKTFSKYILAGLNAYW